MSKSKVALLSMTFLSLLAAPVLAVINPNAPAAAADFNALAAELHDYLHDFYPSSYGAHGIDTESSILASDLAGWEAGTIPESQIAVDWDSLDAAYDTYAKSIRDAKVLHKGDDALDDLHKEVKQSFRQLARMLNRVQG